MTSPHAPTQGRAPSRSRRKAPTLSTDQSKPTETTDPSGYLVQWDRFIRVFLREWAAVLGPACALQTLFIFEQVWRFEDCDATSRAVSGELIRTGEYTIKHADGTKERKRVHAGLGVQRNTFAAHLKKAKEHGLIETTETRRGYRAETVFHVFPDHALAGPGSAPRAQKSTTTDAATDTTPCSKMKHRPCSKIDHGPVLKNRASKQEPRKAGTNKAGTSIGGASLAEHNGEEGKQEKVEPNPAPSERFPERLPTPQSPPPVDPGTPPVRSRRDGGGKGAGSVPVDVEAIKARDQEAKARSQQEQVEWLRTAFTAKENRPLVQ